MRSDLIQKGHEIISLTRHPSPSTSGNDRHEIIWDPDLHRIDASRLDELDAVIHLAGENIAAGRWTSERKRKILESRVSGTRFLCETLNRLSHPPRVLVAASAIGYYGNRGDEVLTEESPKGTGFLSDVCEEWEGATKSARENGIRVVNMRLGMVLGKNGGVVAKLLPIFQWGLGGRLGSGNQIVSWISLQDVCAGFEKAVLDEHLVGPVNLVSPSPVTNAEFTRTLASILSRPAVFHAPSIVLKLVTGEMAEALLLSSARVIPKKLARYGFQFSHPTLTHALRAAI